MGQSKSMRKLLQQVTLLLAIFPVIFLPVVLLLAILPVTFFPVVLLLAILPVIFPLVTLSDPTPDGPPLSPDNNFLPPPGWLESRDLSLQILAFSASTISETLSDVVVPATLRSPPDQVCRATALQKVSPGCTQTLE